MKVIISTHTNYVYTQALFRITAASIAEYEVRDAPEGTSRHRPHGRIASIS